MTGDVEWERANLFDGWDAAAEIDGADVAFTITKAGRIFVWDAHDMNEDLGTVSFIAGHEKTLRAAKHAAELAAQRLGKRHG